ncbi:MAG: diaminopimelate epimerase [Bryobacterales bacterium]|nr:diaminopimelate epimerase [Bryobacterales bacterium]
MKIPFTKAHGARNDFLLTWAEDVTGGDARAMARAICHRHTGIGADGWMLVSPASDNDHGSIRLYNSDGSDSEISGNGTRCAAAFVLISSSAGGLETDTVRIGTGAGTKHLRVLSRRDRLFEFEMNMGSPSYHPQQLRFALDVDGERLDAAILNVGNPQCAVFVDEFPAGWRELGKRIEWHSMFPHRTNVSFVKVLDAHTIEVLFWERGAGETMSSGTGSTGAAAAAVLRKSAISPIEVRTPAGSLPVRWDSADLFLTGPAEIVAQGEFYFESETS